MRINMVISILLTLSACTPSTFVKKEAPNYSTSTPLTLAVSKIDVRHITTPAEVGAGETFMSPWPLLEEWISYRLRPSGIAGTAIIIVNEVNLKHEKMPKPTKWYESQQQKLEGVIDVTVEIYNNRGFKENQINVKASYSQTAAMNLSINEKEQWRQNVVIRVMEDFDRKMAAQLVNTAGVAD